jgi:5-methylcytosine-specific restriction endonuclease McrA
LLYHGALGYRDTVRGRDPDDLDRLSALPLVFGLLPGAALSRRVTLTTTFVPIKPILSEHLRSLGIAPDPTLLDVLKSVATQWSSTLSGVHHRRKYSVSDLRALGTPYRALRRRQSGRCRYCGRRLVDIDEVLDHIVPFRLIGDVPDGANWQLLCSECNAGKGEFLTTYCLPAAYNWVYRIGDNLTEERARTRWIVLAQRGVCDHCGVGPSAAELHVELRRPGDIYVADLLRITCSGHDGE